MSENRDLYQQMFDRGWQDFERGILQRGDPKLKVAVGGWIRAQWWYLEGWRHAQCEALVQSLVKPEFVTKRGP